MPTGAVEFSVDGSPFGNPITLVGGMATLTTSALGVGGHTVTAAFDSDTGHFHPSVGVLAGRQAVTTAGTTTAVTTSAASPTYGRWLVFSATVSPMNSGLPTPTGTVQFEIDGTAFGPVVTLVNGMAASPPIASLGAGAHTVAAVFSGDLNFSTGTSSPLTQAVHPAPLTVTAVGANKVYGQPNPGFTAIYNGFVLGQAPSVLGGTLSFTTPATSASHVLVGGYPITPGGLTSTNYAIRYAPSTLDVIPALLTIIADNKAMTYGGTFPTLTASYQGLVNGDTPASLLTAPTPSTSATASSDVGGYFIFTSGAGDADYTISYAPGTLDITPAPLTIAADDKGMTYGGTFPTLTASYQGLVNGDSPASVTTPPMIATTASNSSHVGRYALTPSGAAAPNYTITFIPGTLAVIPVPLTITATNKGKVYGAPLPALSASYNGLVNGDTPASLGTAAVLTTAATATSHVGAYAIMVGGAVDPDYTISYGNGSLAVTPAPLAIAADNQSKVYGAADPTLTYHITAGSLVSGDGFSGSLTRLTGANAGNYPILQGSLKASADYSLSYIGANLTINPALTTSSLAASANPTATGQPATLTAIVSIVSPGAGILQGNVAFKNGSTILGTVPLAAVNGVALAAFTTAALPVGTDIITASYVNSDGNTLASAATLNQVVLGPGSYAFGTQLFIVGANTADSAQVSSAGSKTDGTTGLKVNTTLNNVYTSKVFSQSFTAIAVYGYGGNDNIQLAASLSLPTTIVEGNGNNYIQTGAGNDVMTFGAGSNQVFGRGGNKAITAQDAAGTTGYIQLGAGNHTINLGAGNDQVLLGDGNNTVTAGNGTDVVIAGNGNNAIILGNGNNYVKAGTGTNTVLMGNGSDNVQLGDGANTVILGDGNNYVSAGNGNNAFTVGNGNNTVQLGGGDNVVVEGNGNDYVSAGNGANLIVGGLGQHTIQLGNGTNILIDGSATLVNPGDSLRQVLTDWKSSASTAVNLRLKVTYNAAHPNYLSAGSGRDWFFYTYPKTTSNRKATDRLNYI